MADISKIKLNGTNYNIKDAVFRSRLNLTSPEMFGAVGDGITDDTNALQRALNTKSVKLKPNSVYKVSNTLIIPSDTVILGSGTIKIADNSALSNGIFNASSKSNIVITDVIFDCNVQNQPGFAQGTGPYNCPIQLISSSNITVSNCKFNGIYGNCVLVDSCDGYINIENNNFVGGITSQSHSDFGVALRYNTSSAFISVINNRFKCSVSNYDYGYGAIFETTESCNTLIDGNVIIGFGRNGNLEPVAPIDLYVDTHNTTISNNKLYNCYRFVRMSAAQNIMISDNMFDEVSAKEPDSGLILAYISTFYGTPHDCKNIIIKGNIIKSETTSVGVIQLSSQTPLYAPHDVIISDNIFNCKYTPVVLYNGSDDVTVSNNKTDGGYSLVWIQDNANTTGRLGSINIEGNIVKCTGPLVYAITNIAAGSKPIIVSGNEAVCTSAGIIKMPVVYSDNVLNFLPGAYAPQPIVTYTQLAVNEHVYLFNNVCSDGFAQTSDAGAIANKNYFDGVEA